MYLSCPPSRRFPCRPRSDHASCLPLPRRPQRRHARPARAHGREIGRPHNRARGPGHPAPWRQRVRHRAAPAPLRPYPPRPELPRPPRPRRGRRPADATTSARLPGLAPRGRPAAPGPLTGPSATSLARPPPQTGGPRRRAPRGRRFSCSTIPNTNTAPSSPFPATTPNANGPRAARARRRSG
ncbi:uncharacterized protein AruCF_4686 [Achromobacter ruhlandii]|nr:uncharacterized protein AruCF_4686 [Achromobacter ruhlandii]